MDRAKQQERGRKPTQVRRKEIIDAGMRILASDGARQFTADRLGAAVGITGGTIFRHFGSMEEILDAIVDRIEEIIFEGFPPQGDSPLESLRLFFETRVRIISDNPDVSKLLLTNMLIPCTEAEHRDKRLRDFKRRSQRFVMRCLKQAQDKGQLAKDVHRDEGAVLVVGAIYALGHMGLRIESTKDTRDLTTRTWRFLEKSLKRSI